MAMDVYLDNAASTSLRPGALDAMMPYFLKHHGNPSGGHKEARIARQAIEESRDSVAEILGCEPSEVIFTSGGTESDNLAVRGSLVGVEGRALYSAIEHPAIMTTLEEFNAQEIPVTSDGRLDMVEFRKALGPDVQFVSVMAANNEVGSIQNLAPIGEVVRELAPDAVIHTDAIQAAPWFDLKDVTAAVDLLSISAHKFGGPNGVGALVHKKGTRLAPQQTGGGHEQERRGGTQNTAGIVGLARALEITVAERDVEVPRIRALRDQLAAGILSGIDGVTTTIDLADSLPNICHLLLAGVESEVLLFLLEKEGVMASAASSCASGAIGLSHVLAALGGDAAKATGAVRLSLGWDTTQADIERGISAVVSSVATARERSR